MSDLQPRPYLICLQGKRIYLLGVKEYSMMQDEDTVGLAWRNQSYLRKAGNTFSYHQRYKEMATLAHRVRHELNRTGTGLIHLLCYERPCNLCSTDMIH